MTATVYAVCNFKGGVGKTTTAVNLAACLAAPVTVEIDGRMVTALAHKPGRVLLVDCDPQANASEMFIPEPQIQYDLRSVISGVGGDRAKRIPVQDVIQSTRITGLDVLPALFELALLDKELVVTPSGVQRIERALRPVGGEYEHIVIDTGPNLSHLTLGALVAAQHIIIPVSATVWGTTGLRKFISWIDSQRDDEVIEARLLGLLATMVIARTRIGRDVVAEIRASDYPKFETVIPRRTAAEDAVFGGVVASDKEMDASLAAAYREFTGEVADLAVRKRGGAHRVIAG